MSELSPEARSIVDAARGLDDPTSADRQRVHAAVMAKIGAGGGSTPSSAPASGAAGGVAGKLLLAVLLVGGLSVGAVMWLRDGGANETAAPASAPAPAPDPAPAPAPAPDPAPDPAPAPVALPQPPPPHPDPPPKGERGEFAEGEEGVSRSVDLKEHQPRHATKRVAKTIEAPPSLSADSLLAERKLLAAASAALRGGNADEALRLVDEHKTKFPKGLLAPERSATRVLALCAAGRTADAKRAASSFLKRWPKSPLARRVRASCASD